MTTPTPPTAILGSAIPSLPRLATAAELAAIFTAYSHLSLQGPRTVTERNVNSWSDRRESTGMPRPDHKRRPGRRGPAVRQWDATAALSWFLAWQPRRGGAPKGNGNALTHGRCVGLRAERETRRDSDPADLLDPQF